MIKTSTTPARAFTLPVAALRIGEAVSRTAEAMLKGLTRVLEALGPQPQLQPIPVRVRRRSGAPSSRG